MTNIKQLILLGAMAAFTSQAAVIAVCASGCNYTDVQPALYAANPGDTIEIAAGQTFTGNYLLPYKSGAGTIIVRSSRWRELPPVGWRVDPSMAALMPTLEDNNGTVLQAGRPAGAIVAVDTSSSYLTADQGYYTEGMPIACSASNATTMPAPLAFGQTYYAKNVSGGYMFQVSASQGGPAIPITSAGSAGSSYYAQAFCAPAQNAHDWTFSGINFQAAANSATPSLVQIGHDEAIVSAVPRNIHLDRVIIQGQESNPNAPQVCLYLDGANLALTDSWVGNCKALGGSESKAISMTNTPGPVLIRNNFLSGASISILTAGQGASIFEQVATGISVIGNHIAKAGYMFFTSGSGAPTLQCYYGNGSGAFYLDTSVTPSTCEGGACYTCQANGTWLHDVSATYRSGNYLTKGALEFKDCNRCLVAGNVLEGVFAGPDSGNAACLGLFQGNQGGLYHYIADTVVTNNWCKDTWSGISPAVNDATPGLLTPSRNISVTNNLVTGMGNFPAMSQWPNASDAHVVPIILSNGTVGVTVDHNTFRPAAGMTYEAQFHIELNNGPSNWGPIQNLRLTNNLFQDGHYGLYEDGDGTCGAGGWQKFAGITGIIANTASYDLGAGSSGWGALCTGWSHLTNPTGTQVAFVSDTDHRLQSTSPYSASCASGCQFAGIDGADLGADIDQIESATSGATSGSPRWADLSELRVSPGSDAAAFQYRSPDDNSCTIAVYDATARTAANQVFNSSDALGWRDGRLRVLVGTGLAASRDYYYELSCSGRRIVGQLKTQAAGSGTYNYSLSLGTTRSVSYSSHSDCSSASTITGNSVNIPVASRAVVYGCGGGAPPVLIAP